MSSISDSSSSESEVSSMKLLGFEVIVLAKTDGTRRVAVIEN